MAESIIGNTVEPGAARRGFDPPAPSLADGAAGERARVLAIQAAGQALRLEAQAAEMVTRGISLEASRTALFQAAVARDEAEAIAGGPRVAGGHDGSDPDIRFRQAVDALAHRLSGGRLPLPENAAAVRGMSLQELHRYVGRGEDTGTWLSRASGGHTTSDYPVLLLEAGANRALLDAFTVAASPLRQVSRMISVPDFRQITRARRGEAAKLLEIQEHGEVVSSTVGEEYERYTVKSYARNFILTRNAIINDDLNAFADFLADMGRAAAITEAGVLTALITGNGPILSDGTTLWHANHGNLGSPAAALAVGPLGLARKAMRLQQSMTNDEPLNLTPRFLLVPAALESTADQLLATLTPTTIGEVNPFANALTLLVEPRLDAASATAWYVIADPGSMPFLEIATLDGTRRMATAGAPQLTTFGGEDVLGLKMRAVHDFGAFPINFRAAFKNAGA